MVESMITINQEFEVSYKYGVYFTRHVFDIANTLLVQQMKPQHNRPARALIVIDAGVDIATPGLRGQIETYFKCHAEKIELLQTPLIVPGGETAKNSWDTVRELIQIAAQKHLDRHSYIIAIGGGSILDMTGFAAALIHRGVRLIRLPTTVLAQNDAGVGVKNGMNAGGAKNFVGTFAPPAAVINDFEFLKTLEQREWCAGLSESFKVAITQDKPFFDWLCTHAAALKQREQGIMEQAVWKTAQIHLHHIATSGDPFEFGNSRPLDFGHWSAHRLEFLSQFTINHGEAVAIGIALDSAYAMLQNLISYETLTSIIRGLLDAGLPIYSELLQVKNNAGENEILQGLEQFREHLGGELCITLPDPLGKKSEFNTMDISAVMDAIDLLAQMNQQA